jgi:hypothetical protein
MNTAPLPPGDGPVLDAQRCADLLTPDDFARVGVPGAGTPTVNIAERDSAFLVYAGRSGGTGGIELDLFVSDHPESTFATASTVASRLGRPAPGLPAEEALVTTGMDNSRGGKFAAILVREGRLIFAISLPDSPNAESQLSALARIVLERTHRQSWPGQTGHIASTSTSSRLFGVSGVKQAPSHGCAVTAFRLFLIPFVVVGIGLLLAVPVAAYVKYLGTPVTAVVDRRVFVHGDPEEPAYHIYYHFTLGDTRYDTWDFASEQENAQVSNTVSGRAAQAFGFARFLTPRGFASANLILLTGFALGWNLPIYVFLHVIWIAPVRARRRALRQQLS